MKSFSEYIKEAYNFRLGGSQQKGFDQNEVKTFGELEEGDIFYLYTIETRTAWKRTFIELRKEDAREKILYRTDRHGGRYYINIDGTDNENKSIYNDNRFYIVATDEHLFMEELENSGIKINSIVDDAL